jgi:hypothetical protein
LSRIRQSEIVIDSDLHPTSLDLENALGGQIHQHIPSSDLRANLWSRKKNNLSFAGWKPVRVDVWEAITAFRAPQRLNKPTGEWHSKPVSGAATFLRLEPEDSPALNAYSDRGLKSYAN